MRLFLGCILVAALALLPAAPRANAAGPDDSPAKKAADSSSNSTSEAAAKPAASAEPAKSSLESEIEELRDLLLTQSEQLQAQSDQLKQQQQKMQLLESELNKASGTPARLAETPAPLPAPSPGIPSASIPIPSAAVAAAAPQGGNAIPESPLQFRLGTAFFTPIGFMDFTGVFRNHNAGGGIGSNFGSIPYDYPTSPTSINLLNHVNEARLSIQNSRLGLRVDALVKGAHVMGYVETDFLGNNPTNVAVSSNSNTLRSRLYWVDVAKGKWEFLGGQTWSPITRAAPASRPCQGICSSHKTLT